MRITNVYKEARERLEDLRKEYVDIQQRLKKAPEGKIHVIKSRAKNQYYLRKDSKDRSGTYLPQSKLPIIQTYLQKSYDEKALKLISKEIASLEKLLKQSNDNDILIQNLYSNHPEEIKKLINPIDMNPKDYEGKWQDIPYMRKPVLENVPIYITNNKEQVRSKSELNIANTLERYKVPYKYECPLQLQNGNVIYPDFTIYNSKNQEIYYWEHRGMMDDRDYAKHSVKRVKEYAKNRIYLGKNLIITEEASTAPLGTDEILATINAYFK